MGRFKIYDTSKLLRIENGSSYGTCLLCGKKLKHIMGNIKRHYEQIHCVFVDANAKKSKKSKRKRAKLNKDKDAFVDSSVQETDNTELFNTSTTSISPTCISENKVHIKEQTFDGRPKQTTASTNPFNTPTTSISPICINRNNNINNSPKDLEVNLQQNEDKKSAISQQTQVDGTFQLQLQESATPVIEEGKRSKDIDGNTCTPNSQPDNQMSACHSGVKKARLLEENDRIQIPCYSFLNNIQINSVESCSQLEFLKCLVETKSHVNIPLQTLQNEDTFQKALQNWKPSFQFNYSPQTIGEHIDRMTKKLHQDIKQLVANRIIYLKLDIVSSTEGNVMLVNIQFIKDFTLQVITLNALELSNDDLAAYLKKKVLSTLERFRIDISNVFSITKDNTNNSRNYIKNPENRSDHVSNAAEYCQNLSHGFPGHAIHFAASDIITQLNENISQSRDSARNLYRQMLHFNTKSSILFDNNTNWFSVYDMIESLMTAHDKVENNCLALIEVDWAFAKKFVESFKPVVDTALMLQTTDIVLMGDFYREWLLCEMKLEELSVGNELALYLLKALHKRKAEFFENPTFLAALYMDPRFCYMGSMHLTDKQKEMAIIQLLQIFSKLKIMHKHSSPLHSTNNSNINLNDRYNKLERHINKAKFDIDATTDHQAVSLHDVDEQCIKESLVQVQFQERLVLKTDILEYWNVAKYKNPILAKLAEIALAAPATQATLSRALNTSSRTLLKGKLRENKENIENVLLLKLNQDLVDKISLEN